MRDFPELRARDPVSRTDEDLCLDVDDLHADALEMFARWLAEALERSPYGANAMTVATASVEGVPSARIVLLKGFDERGFVFFTNYESRKGRELDQTGRAALLFYWPQLQRQVRVEGTVERTSRDESEAYFASRPEIKRVAVWASGRQSAVIESREALDARVAELQRTFEGTEIPCPETWGGYRVAPQALEFWQGRPTRLHDRFLYTRSAQGWRIDRLAP